ncbi:serine/threonine-protein kinase-transforming protein Rmil [BeAn 58058 virus]|uniref:serine/threonine-protein kinase-transforming protein Rmil n=1 Tax=BeAn 58058 virus TaxID=67082 RepID=UPI00090B7A18|nr:serine/threonine-protein kinase-transforming protein Rmil [BeAn 58058 virus]APG58363.1 serine/threonine-protein kinase-transforming protein Rmil [BeAn 58058 virus]
MTDPLLHKLFPVAVNSNIKVIKDTDVVKVENENICECKNSYVYNAIYNNEEALVIMFKHSHTGYKVLLDISEKYNILQQKHEKNVLRIYAVFIDNSYINFKLPKISLIVEKCKPIRRLILEKINLPFESKIDLILNALDSLILLYTYTKEPYKYINSSNFLINSDYDVKIVSHGLEIILSNPAFNTIKSSSYYSPKIIMNPFSKQTISDDIYSFGILMYEILSYKIPFENMKSRDIISCVESNKIESILNISSINCPDTLKNLIKKCVSIDPVIRPSFKEIYQNISIYKFNKKIE